MLIKFIITEIVTLVLVSVILVVYSKIVYNDPIIIVNTGIDVFNQELNCTLMVKDFVVSRMNLLICTSTSYLVIKTMFWVLFCYRCIV
jgi:hypothetical protein